MSGGAHTQEDDATTIARDGMAVERLLDEEMKDDAATTPSTCGSPAACASGSDSGASSRAGSRPGSATETTWNFVQMNMTLLPIARPLPVSVPSRLHEGLLGRKPRTPNQKLHHRVLRSASNISPRHNDADNSNMLRRRGSTSSENGTAASPSIYSIPRPTVPERQFSAPLSLTTRCGKRKSDHDDDHYLSSSWQSPSLFYRPHAASESEDDAENRARSFSEDLLGQDAATSSSEGCVLSRSASTSAAFARRGALFKDKRILEIQDEERRLVPNERAGLASPTKRSRRS